MNKLIKSITLLAVSILCIALMPRTVSAYGDFSNHANDKEDEHNTLPNYVIRVNRCMNCVTIYEVEEGHGEKPIKAMACSTGKPWHPTAKGTFKTSDYYEWRLMCGDCYSQYATRFNGMMLFHSVPYDRPTKDSIWSAQYNMLGEYASSGCVRLSVIDAKWIYDNCKKGTKVVVYDNPNNPGPLGKPEPVYLDLNSPYKGWDPTDPDPENPWIEVFKEREAQKEAKLKEAEKKKEEAVQKAEEWKQIRENIEGCQ